MSAGAVEAAAPTLRRGITADRRALPGALLVSAATALSGVLTYAFLVLAARTLGPAAYGRIGILWAAMFIVAIVLFRPLEQTASQAIAARAARGDDGTAVVRAVTGAALGLIALVLCVSLALWPVLQARLFDGSTVLTLLLVAGIALYGISYVVRGVVGGIRWFPGYGILLVADAAARLLIALPLLMTASTFVAGVAVAAAGACGAVAPLVLGRRRILGRLAAGRPGEYRLRTAASFALPAAVVAACDQIVVNGPPLLVAADGASSRTVGLVFAATMLLRAPVYVFQGLAASLLPNFTHLRGAHELRRLRQQLLRLALALVAVGVCIAGGAALAGPQAMRILYGDRYVVSRGSLVLLGVAVGAYLVAATLSQALLAAQRAWGAAAVWAAMLACFVGAFVLLPGGQLERVSGALAGAALLGAVLLARRAAVVTRA